MTVIVYRAYSLLSDAVDLEDLYFSVVCDDDGATYVVPPGESWPDERHVEDVIERFWDGEKPENAVEWSRAARYRLNMFYRLIPPGYYNSTKEAVKGEKKIVTKAAKERKLFEKLSEEARIAEAEEAADAMTAAAGNSCPTATSDIALNTKNRQKAIDTAKYGPLNPGRPNTAFWQEKADRWGTTVEEAKSSRCGNCAAFIVTPAMRECISNGLSGDNAYDVVEAGDLGYCEAFDFKCAAERTCDVWITGGPVTEEKK